jgi:hypothetical protein
MTTKYIVDNLTGQTITGDITINGNLSVTGVTTGSLATYKALLTQLGSQTGTTLNDFNDGLIIGETYTITDYVSGDSFSNVANVTSGVIDTTGCEFIATGETPTNWSNGSTLVSSGNLVVKVLENNLGFDIEWVNDDEFQPGFYLGVNSTTGPLYNTFNRNTTFVQGGGSSISFFGPFISETFATPISFNEKDDSVVVAIFDLSEEPTPVSDNLYYFPIEIQIQQDTDTTPIVISGTVESSFPINDTSISLFCNGNYIQSLYGDGTVNDMSELITYLNSLPNTSYLGTYSNDGDGVLLEMSTNLVNQFCSSGTLTFEVFND